MKILFVCTGNICRSPMAEVIFANLCAKKGRNDVTIKGAGTGATPGEIMTAEAREALKRCGEKVGKGERPCTRWRSEMVDEFDHIVCMTAEHVKQIKRDTPKDCKNVYNLDSIAGCGDIFDPWQYPIEIYVNVCRVLQNALNKLYAVIVEEK